MWRAKNLRGEKKTHLHAMTQFDNSTIGIIVYFAKYITTIMSKPRPGVQAAKRLSKCDDKEIWSLVEKQFSKVVAHLKGFKEIESEYHRIGRSFEDESKESITKEDLLTIVRWKFAVGKPRHALMKHLTSNTESLVRELSASSIATARNSTESDKDSSKKSLEEFAKLKGVGPATASALLALVQPDLFAYMYDEVIECFLPKRTYTLSTYMVLNKNCSRIARNLGDGWTPSRVATVLWTAARAEAHDLNDFTMCKRPLVDKNIIADGDDRSRRAIKRRKS